MAETARARAWITITLKNDPVMQSLVPTIATQGVFDRPASAGTRYPLVRMEVLSGGNDLYVLGNARIWSAPTILVYAAIDKPSTGSIEPIDDRIDELLNGGGTVNGGIVWWCRRLRPFDLPDTSVVPSISRLGGEYRIQVSKTA